METNPLCIPEGASPRTRLIFSVEHQLTIYNNLHESNDTQGLEKVSRIPGGTTPLGAQRGGCCMTFAPYSTRVPGPCSQMCPKLSLFSKVAMSYSILRIPGTMGSAASYFGFLGQESKANVASHNSVLPHQRTTGHVRRRAGPTERKKIS